MRREWADLMLKADDRSKLPESFDLAAKVNQTLTNEAFLLV